MPATNMALQNNFNNFNLASLGGGQQYPPQQYPPQQYPPIQQNMNQGPPQNMGGYNQQQQFNNSNMAMTPGMNNNNPYGQGYWVFTISHATLIFILYIFRKILIRINFLMKNVFELSRYKWYIRVRG